MIQLAKCAGLVLLMGGAGFYAADLQAIPTEYDLPDRLRMIVTDTPSLPISATPGTESNIVARIPAGQEVLVLPNPGPFRISNHGPADSTWVLLRWNGREGYADGYFLKHLPEVTAHPLALLPRDPIQAFLNIRGRIGMRITLSRPADFSATVVWNNFHCSTSDIEICTITLVEPDSNGLRIGLRISQCMDAVNCFSWAPNTIAWANLDCRISKEHLTELLLKPFVNRSLPCTDAQRQ